MSNLYDAQLELPVGAHAPDEWDHGGGVELLLDHVISKDKDGKPVSHVGDLVWNWKWYTPRRKTANLSFFFWHKAGTPRNVNEDVTIRRLALMRELQYLMVLRVYHAERVLSFWSLFSDLSAVRQIAWFADGQGCSLRNVLEQSALLDAYISKTPESQCHGLVRWLNFLRSDVTATQLGFELALPKKWAELKKRSNDYISSHLQTAPLPSRIYLELINAVETELNDIELHQDRLLATLREAIVLHREHKVNEANEDKGWERKSGFGPALLERHGLGGYLTGRGLEETLAGLTSAVTNIQRVCKLQVHIFSGMREEEAEHLPYHCMETVKVGHGRRHSLIVGITTKLAGARAQRTRWVTTADQGFRAIKLAQKFADVIYECVEVTPSTEEKAKDSFPLFVTTGYLDWSASRVDNPTSQRFAPTSNLQTFAIADSLQTALFPIIEEEDIEELLAIDPFRDWINEADFTIGVRWNLKSHQLRRSLALYANASGLVKTSSLKRQLQHITREMAGYYGRGSVFAMNFLKDDPKNYRQHICREWQDGEHEAQYLAFTRDVLKADEPLCGPAGFFYDLKTQRGEVMSPQEVKEQLKLGRMAYKDHPLGGCTHVGTCDKQKGLRFTSGICISESCKFLIGKHSKIIKLIPLQRRIVASLEPGSIVFDMEKEELDILEGAEIKWRAETRPKSASQGGVNV